MSFFRNSEVKRLFLTIIIFSIIFIVTGFMIHVTTGILVLITVITLCVIFVFFTFTRYKRIEKLSSYLRLISAGEHSLDIRDNTEGELSILKNEIYKVTMMLSEYNESLKREKIYLSNQIADISHQIKTPLTSIMVMVDLLQKEDTPADKRKEFTEHIISQLERTEWLVSSLLKMSKLDAGVVQMKAEQLSTDTLIERAIRPLQILIEVKDICLSIKNNSQIIVCDLNWTAEAITNILKNCAEHTQKGGHISISAQNNPICSEISITDNGKGIAKEDLPYIFNRFYRGKNASSESVGIGLAMAKSIIKAQKGDITVESKAQQGSIFTIRFYKSVV